MQLFFILITTALLFLGCGGSDTTSTVTVQSINNNTQLDRVTYSTRSYIEHISTVGLHGEALDIALSEDKNFAYIASGDYGLQILDISDREQVKLITTNYSYGYVNHVEVIGDIVYTSYVAQSWEDYERLNAYDVSYPYDVTYLGYQEGYTSHSHTKVQSGEYLYYLVNNALYAVNQNQNDYQSYSLYSPYALALCEDYLFVANGREGLSIFKVANTFTSTLTNP